MIKIENVEVVGWEHAIRGMRNPKNSWDRSDSEPCDGICGTCGANDGHGHCLSSTYIVGSNDHKLMTQLAAGGPVHAKYRRMIAVYMDITAPLYFLKEFDTYKVGTVSNSCSTMHKIHEKEFTWSDFSHEHLTDGAMYIMKLTIDELNCWRSRFLAWDDIDDENKERNGWHDKKDLWWQMIQLLPSSYNQKRTIMLNYEVLTGIYRDRNNHKLDEWREFCKWIESLPYSELITGDRDLNLVHPVAPLVDRSKLHTGGVRLGEPGEGKEFTVDYSDLDDFEKLMEDEANIKSLHEHVDKFARVNVASQEECEAVLKEVNKNEEINKFSNDNYGGSRLFNRL